MNNDNGTQLNLNENGTQLNKQFILNKQYLGERTAKCNEVLLRKGDILVMKWLKQLKWRQDESYWS